MSQAPPPPPPVPPMGKLLPHQEQALHALLQRTVDLVVRKAGWHTTCITCVHFNEAAEVCALYNARPPARVIATGCPTWKDEPF